MKLKYVFIIGLLMILNKTTYCRWVSDEESSEETEDYETKEKTTTVKTEVKRYCPDNFVLLNDFCYHIPIDKKLNWHQANDECEIMNAELAQIKNDQELDALKQHLEHLQQDWPISLWVAGIDTDSDKEFQWKPDGETITYAKWNDNEPTSTFDENCISLKERNNYLMSDLNCMRKMSFICKSKQMDKICPHKYSLIGNKCYFIEKTEQLDYFDAKITCLSKNAKLTKIENSSELKALNRYLTYHEIERVWIAGSDLRSEGEYYWDNVEDKMTFTNWGPGQPDTYDPYEHCVELVQGSNSYMNDKNCYSELAYVCETPLKDMNELLMEKTIKRVKIFETGKDCPKDFTKVGNKCYFVQNIKKSNWHNADRDCKKLKSDLLTIESAAEMDLLVQYLQDVDGAVWSWALRQFWTAANDLGSEENFYWHSNGRNMSYSRWFPREPNNTHDEEHCVNLKYYDDGYYMNDDRCQKRMFYVCETKLLKKDLPNTSSELDRKTDLELGVNTCSELDLLQMGLASQRTVMKMMSSKLSCNN